MFNQVIMSGGMLSQQVAFLTLRNCGSTLSQGYSLCRVSVHVLSVSIWVSSGFSREFTRGVKPCTNIYIMKASILLAFHRATVSSTQPCVSGVGGSVT